MPRPNSNTIVRFFIQARIKEKELNELMPMPSAGLAFVNTPEKMCVNTLAVQVPGQWFNEFSGEYMTVEEARAQVKEREKTRSDREFRVCKQTLTVEVM